MAYIIHRVEDVTEFVRLEQEGIKLATDEHDLGSLVKALALRQRETETARAEAVRHCCRGGDTIRISAEA